MDLSKSSVDAKVGGFLHFGWLMDMMKLGNNECSKAWCN